MCLGQSRGDGSLGDSEHLADLGVRDVREVPQEDRQPSLARQLPNGGREVGSPLSSTNATSGTSSTASSRDPFEPIATRNAIRHTHASSDPRHGTRPDRAAANASCTTSRALSTLPVTEASITWNAPCRRR